MPELPEVETVRRLIEPDVVGRTVVDAVARWQRTVGGSAGRFRAALVGARIERVRRRAKFLVFELSRSGGCGGAILCHLRMTGRLYVRNQGEAEDPHDRALLDLDDGRRLHFLDVRKFGRFEHVADPAARLDGLGPEPLGDAFTAEWFAAALKARRRQLKPLLLDQSFVAGLGNIYVDESLHRAGLHPLTQSDRVSTVRARRLQTEIRATLAEAIEREGSSFDRFYQTPAGQPGGYQHQFQVYGRDGQPCSSCGATIVKLVVGQRGTHICRRCQPTPRPR
ncbi:MAG: bifunctional DNA-formamidopyrimidine glycosylase/DNA-(apurinic or apyrimidinic site) lyase [Planctomycetota bacterium]